MEGKKKKYIRLCPPPSQVLTALPSAPVIGTGLVMRRKGLDFVKSPSSYSVFSMNLSSQN